MKTNVQNLTENLWQLTLIIVYHLMMKEIVEVERITWKQTQRHWLLIRLSLRSSIFCSIEKKLNSTLIIQLKDFKVNWIPLRNKIQFLKQLWLKWKDKSNKWRLISIRFKSTCSLMIVKLWNIRISKRITSQKSEGLQNQNKTSFLGFHQPKANDIFLLFHFFPYLLSSAVTLLFKNNLIFKIRILKYLSKLNYVKYSLIKLLFNLPNSIIVFLRYLHSMFMGT